MVSTAIVCSRLACPSLPVRFIQAHPSQAAARVNLEIMHDSLWLSLGFHHRVHGMASHVGREQIPAAITSYLLNGL